MQVKMQDVFEVFRQNNLNPQHWFVVHNFKYTRIKTAEAVYLFSKCSQEYETSTCHQLFAKIVLCLFLRLTAQLTASKETNLNI